MQFIAGKADVLLLSSRAKVIRPGGRLMELSIGERPLYNSLSVRSYELFDASIGLPLDSENSALWPQTFQDLPASVGPFTSSGWVPKKAHNVVESGYAEISENIRHSVAV